MIELLVDNFAGGGGASHGIELALGRPVDIAINHDPVALAIHAANHPRTLHLCEDVFDVDPVAVASGRPVGLMWLSPDCKHFSKAKGGRPVDKRIRGLAWVAVRWAATVHPRVIVLENVEEFQTWGPLGKDGRPCPRRRGRTFRAFVGRLRGEGYAVEWRELRACDYGAPTTRKRLFLIARCDGRPIAWPGQTHAAPADLRVQAGQLLPWRTAAECIYWSIPCPSIFGRARQLSDATLRRVALGIRRFVLESAAPFIMPMTHTGSDRVADIDAPLPTITSAHRGEFALVAAFLAKHFGGPGGHQTPGSSADRPLGAVTSVDHHGLAAVALVRQFGTSTAASVEQPVGVVMPDGGGKTQLVRAFLTKYYGTAVGSRLGAPVPAVTSHDRFGLVTVHGEDYAIADIGLRMLVPRELFRAQGFADSYVIDPIVGGKRLSKTAQVRAVGNSVCPPMAAAIVAANCAEMRVERGTQVKMFREATA